LRSLSDLPASAEGALGIDGRGELELPLAESDMRELLTGTEPNAFTAQA
jgi:hypothetical protein